MNKYVKIYIGIGVAVAIYDLYAGSAGGVSGKAIQFVETVAIWPYYAFVDVSKISKSNQL